MININHRSKHFFINPNNAHNYTSLCASVRYARLKHRLVCRQDIDHVINDEHNRTIIVVLAKHEIVP